MLLDLEESSTWVRPSGILRLLVAFCVVSSLLAWSMSGSLVSGLSLALVACVAGRLWVRRAVFKKRSRIQAQLPEALTLVGNALSSGGSLIQALEHAVRETSPPIAGELAIAVDEVRVGMSLDEALDRLNRRLAVPELESVIVALSIQRRAGGNLTELLQNANDMLKEQARLKGDLMVATAQARLSGKLVGLMPLVLTAVIFILDPAYLSPLFTTALGISMILAAATAQAAGFLIINRLLNVEF
ncbi:MAG: type II secretion system F family protein [Candidatus Aquicultorales bacterium]